MIKSRPRRAALYCRISSDRSGERLGVARQESSGRERAASLGWDVVHVYTDNDVSASGTKPRPQYQAMLASLEEGHIDAVIVWDLDRLTRRPIEIEQFIELADRRGVALASVDRDVDLATDSGRLYARIKGAVARGEVERKATRQRAANSQRAAAGQVHVGRRAFGYDKTGHRIVQKEAKELRAAAETMIAGGTIRGIVRDWEIRGVKTTAGNTWRPTELRRALSNPRYAGRVVYQGAVIDAKARHSAILDADTFAALQAVLTDPARHRAGRPQRYLLSGLARCGTCGGVVYGTVVRAGAWAVYHCETRRHVTRKGAPVDELVLDVVAARLAQPDAADLLSQPNDGETDRAQIRVAETAARARLDGLAEAFASGDIDREQLRRGSERLHRELDGLAERMRTTLGSPVLSTLIGSDDVRSALDGMLLDQQREVVRALLTVRLHSPGKGRRELDPATVELAWVECMTEESSARIRARTAV